MSNISIFYSMRGTQVCIGPRETTNHLTPPLTALKTTFFFFVDSTRNINENFQGRKKEKSGEKLMFEH